MPVTLINSLSLLNVLVKENTERDSEPYEYYKMLPWLCINEGPVCIIIGWTDPGL